MAKDKITDYSATNASNTDLGGIDIQGTGYISNGDNAIRELMTHLADVSKGTYPVADTWSFADPADLTKIARLDCGSITTSSTRVITIPDRSGVLMTGPSSTTDNGIPRFDGTSGNIQTSNTNVTISDTGGFRAGAGSAADPSYSWTTGGDGFYLRSSGSVGIAIDATEVGYWQSTGLIMAANNYITYSGTGAASQRTQLAVTIAADGNLGTYSGSGASNGRDFSSNGGRNTRSSSTSTGSGNHAEFANPNGTVGSISTSGSGTAFNTTSDELYKNFVGVYDPKTAMKIIRADPTRAFHWKATGEYAVGWGAQTSYKVSPDLASPGGWFDKDTEQPAKEGDANAVYKPWGIDQSKRTPYLWAVVPWMDDRIGELEKEVAKLRKIVERAK